MIHDDPWWYMMIHDQNPVFCICWVAVKPFSASLTTRLMRNTRRIDLDNSQGPKIPRKDPKLRILSIFLKFFDRTCSITWPSETNLGRKWNFHEICPEWSVRPLETTIRRRISRRIAWNQPKYPFIPPKIEIWENRFSARSVPLGQAVVVPDYAHKWVY